MPRALERLPADQLASAELVDARVAGDAEQPGLDFDGNRGPPVPRPLGLFPGREGQIVTIVRVAHEALDLAEHGGIVHRKRVFDGDWLAARLGQYWGLG